MKSTVLYSFIISLILTHINISYGQERPEIIGANHVRGHWIQGESFSYSTGKDVMSNFGCLDPTQPFSITLDFEHYEQISGTSFYVEHHGSFLIDMVLNDPFTQNQDGSGSITIQFDSIEDLNCNDDPSPILTLGFSANLWSQVMTDYETTNIQIELCCDGFLLDSNDPPKSTAIKLGQLSNPLEIGQILDLNEKFTNQELKFQIDIIDCSGKLVSSNNSYFLHYVDLSKIGNTGTYFLLIKEKEQKFSFIQKILVIN